MYYIRVLLYMTRDTRLKNREFRDITLHTYLISGLPTYESDYMN